MILILVVMYFTKVCDTVLEADIDSLGVEWHNTQITILYGYVIH